MGPTPAPEIDSDLDIELVARLRVGVARLNRRLRQQGGGLSPTLQSALVTIEKHGPMTLGALAEAEQVAPATVTKIVTRLREDGLVDRAGDVDDRRVVNVSLTAAGAARLAETRSRRTAYLVTRIAEGSIDPARLQIAAEILEELAAAPGIEP